MAGWIVFKKTRVYEGGPGRGNKVYDTAEEALAVAVELTQTNPVGFDVLPFKEFAPKSDEQRFHETVEAMDGLARSHLKKSLDERAGLSDAAARQRAWLKKHEG